LIILQVSFILLSTTSSAGTYLHFKFDHRLSRYGTVWCFHLYDGGCCLLLLVGQLASLDLMGQDLKGALLNFVDFALV